MAKEAKAPLMLSHRRIAALAGKTQYRTGRQCRRGHLSPRYTYNGACITCVKINRGAKLTSLIYGSRRRAKKNGHSPINPQTISPYPNDRRCELCGHEAKNRKLHADHDHITGRFRGWICYRCNSALTIIDLVGIEKIKRFIG